jgi:hypothetical protein
MSASEGAHWSILCAVTGLKSATGIAGFPDVIEQVNFLVITVIACTFLRGDALSFVIFDHPIRTLATWLAIFTSGAFKISRGQ